MKAIKLLGILTSSFLSVETIFEVFWASSDF